MQQHRLLAAQPHLVRHNVLRVGRQVGMGMSYSTPRKNHAVKTCYANRDAKMHAGVVCMGDKTCPARSLWLSPGCPPPR